MDTPLDTLPILPCLCGYLGISHSRHSSCGGLGVEIPGETDLDRSIGVDITTMLMNRVEGFF